MERKNDASKKVTPLDKEDAIEFLKDTFSRDLITIDDFEKRVEAVHASNLLTELHETIADLPNEAIENLRKITESEHLAMNMETRTLDGSILLTRKLSLKSKLSTITIDYQKISLPDGVYELDINAVLTNITIKLPKRSQFENQISTRLASVVGPEVVGKAPTRRNILIKLLGDIEKTEIRILNSL